MVEGIREGAVQKLLEVPSRQVAVLVVIPSPLNTPGLKLKHLVSIGAVAADNIAAARERLAEVHRADRALPDLLAHRVEGRGAEAD